MKKNLWTPIFTSHYRLQDTTATPPPPGFYRYTGYDVWGPEEVLSELGVSNLTVLTTRGDNRCDHTATPREICGSDYGALPLADGKLYVIAATLSGFSPAFYSPTGSRGSFHSAIPRWLQSVHRTQVGTTWLSAGYNSSVGLSDYLFANFVAQALDGSNATVGDAFVHAWDGYWTAPGNLKPDARSVSYAMILWGLPTQPIRHGSGSALATAADVRASGLNGDWRNLAGPAAPALDRSFSVEINVPNFQVDADATGALLIRPANGGATYAEGPDLPLVPQVVKRFVLPPNARDILVTEDTAARVMQAYGAARLQTAELHLDCKGECTIGGEAAAAATDIYPGQAFDTEVQQRPDATVLTLAAVPAQYAPDGQLTLFTKMRFTVSYKLPTVPGVSITSLVVNAGQAVRAGTAAVPLNINVTSDAARPINVTYAVDDPSGFSIGGGVATANLPKGASQVKLTLNAGHWPPGPKVLATTIADQVGALDAMSTNIQVLGLRITADPDSTPMPVGKPVPLTVRAWDENGVPVAGLAARLTVQVDGTAHVVAFAEGPTGRYEGALSTTGLAVGAHQVTVSATDNRNLSAETWTAFKIARLTYLPLVLK